MGIVNGISPESILKSLFLKKFAQNPESIIKELPYLSLHLTVSALNFVKPELIS